MDIVYGNGRVVIFAIAKPIKTEIVEDDGVSVFTAIAFFYVKADGAVRQDAG